MCAALRLVGWALLATLSLGVAAQPWTVYTHSLSDQAEPVGDSLRGKPHAGKRSYYLELVRAVLRELDYPDRVQEVPLARGLMLLRTTDNVALFNLSRTPQRESTVRWVGPISQEIDYLYENAHASTGIHSLEDARDLPVCVVNGNVHDNILSGMGFTQINRNQSITGCFRMLERGRVRLVASASLGVDQMLKAAQIEPRTVQITPVVVSMLPPAEN